MNKNHMTLTDSVTYKYRTAKLHLRSPYDIYNALKSHTITFDIVHNVENTCTCVHMHRDLCLYPCITVTITVWRFIDLFNYFVT